LKLYELSELADRLQRVLEESGGEITPEAEDCLARLGELPDKMDDIGRVLAGLKRRHECCDAEVKRLTAVREAARRAERSLKEYALANLKKLGHQSYKTPLFTFSVCQNPAPSIRFDGDLADLSPDWVRTEQKFDALKAQKYWREGEPLPEGVVVEKGEHLRVI
jgi:hypothetical protein